MPYIHGNSQANYIYHRKCVGEICHKCGGRGKVYPADENELKEQLRDLIWYSFYKPSFADLCAIWREWRKSGEIDCPVCDEGRIYG